MSRFSSALELAQELTREANRIKSGVKAEQDAARVLKRVDETTVTLARLDQVVKAMRALAAASGTESVGLSQLGEGREAFARNAERSGFLPSDQAFNGARARIGDVTKRVSEELTAAWTQWTGQGIGELRVARMPMLTEGERRPAQQQLKELRDYTKKPVPTIGDISQFKVVLAGLTELLGQVPDPDGELVPLLEQLAVHPILLAELSDEQIALLRQVADQVEIRRRGV
jgi:hypothetical protein